MILSVNTLDYDVDIAKLLRRRLKAISSDIDVYDINGEGSMVEADIDEKTIAPWCDALCDLLLKDLAHFEMARLVNDMPLSLSDKQLILPEAIKASRSVAAANGIKRMLREYFEENRHLNLEGFLRFRMQDVIRSFERCVESACEELLIKTEYLELMNVLSAFVRFQQPKIREVSLIMNADGSCTLTDDSDSRIDYARGKNDNLVSVLVSLAPEKITVYDLSCGNNAMLADMLRRVFDGRVKFYR